MRNRDILRDLYDYSSVIVAAGKIEAGLRPYADFRSTMQSATYALNRAVEVVFGSNYLALTWGGLCLTLAGGTVLTALWRRSFGWPVAILLAGAVALSGLSQHVVIFYNPLGLLCLAVATVALAQDPRLWRLRSPASATAFLALMLGGTNKINFQAFACGLAVLLILRGWWLREHGWRSTLASLGMVGLGGVVLPLGIELAWTGASLSEWIDNVLLLPSERVGFVSEFLRRDIITRPAYDLYHHIIFKRLTLVGLLLIAATATAAWRALAGDPLRGRIALWLLVAVPVCAGGGLLLTVTNVETFTLTSLAFPICAAALWAALSGRMAPAVRRRGALTLAVASVLWTVVGGYAAWEGSRVMFGATPPPRASFVRVRSEAPALAYLQGVRLDAGLHRSLLLAVPELERLQRERGDLSTVLFGPAMEWMERAYPESILRGMPVWYHHGTALRSDDGPWLKERLASKHIDRLVLHPSWESWPTPFRDHLDRQFRKAEYGPCLRIYSAIPPEEAASAGIPSLAALRPLMFCRRTNSNLHLGTANIPHGIDLCDGPRGEFLGRAGSSSWTWLPGAADMRGEFCARLDGRLDQPVRVSWRIVAEADRREVRSGTVVLSADVPFAHESFEVQGRAETLRFEVVVPAESSGQVTAGWRELWIRQAAPGQSGPPPRSVDGSENGLHENESPGQLVRQARPAERAEDHTLTGPFEAWRACGPVCAPWNVRVHAMPRSDVSGSPTVVALVWYKAGRIEILREKMTGLGDPETIELEGWMPEPDGWTGVFARAADTAQPPNCVMRIESWRP